MKITVTLTDENHRPITNHPVDIAFEKPDKWTIDHWNDVTDQNGRLVKEIQLPYKQIGYYLIYIGVKYQKGNFLKQYAKVLQFWLE